MMRTILGALLALAVLVSAEAFAAPAAAAPKEWTFLVFINGNNNLDRYGALNINQMEDVGSTDQINVVVQWASYAARRTKRLYVTRDDQPTTVTSPVLDDLGMVDMGDWRNFVEFVRWGHENFPAKRYFIAMWNHGSGWHTLKRAQRATRGGRGSGFGDVGITDISFDDFSGNFISTEQLGTAMAESARILGQKVDLFASDACLMSMVEVASEMRDSVRVFAGSEEVEPAEGWPYDDLLRRWSAKPASPPAEVARILTEEYVRYYREGVDVRRSEVQFSAFDLDGTEALHRAVARLGGELRALPAAERGKIVDAIVRTQSFEYGDYADLGDFLKQLRAGRVAGISDEAITQAQGALRSYVAVNASTPSYAKAQGAAIWLPASRYVHDSHASRYAGLRFHRETGWGDALRSLFD